MVSHLNIHLYFTGVWPSFLSVSSICYKWINSIHLVLLVSSCMHLELTEYWLWFLSDTCTGSFQLEDSSFQSDICFIWSITTLRIFFANRIICYPIVPRDMLISFCVIRMDLRSVIFLTWFCRSMEPHYWHLKLFVWMTLSHGYHHSAQIRFKKMWHSWPWYNPKDFPDLKAFSSLFFYNFLREFYSEP